jgi:signal transduction histidine kinase
MCSDDALALEAAGRRRRRGTVERDGVQQAEIGVPVEANSVARGADDRPPVRRRAGKRDFLLWRISLAASWLVGALLALKLTGRIRRLEVAAERIADGDFDAEVVDPTRDELADLARAFERMRVRLSLLDRARREFIANASHELRTPLFALGGFLELLADEEMDEATRRDFLDTARGQADRLTRLATDLLDLSRLDADQLGVTSEPVELAGVAQELVDELGPLAETSGHRLHVTAREAVAFGDEERIMQVGRSLIENALRHTPPGTEVDGAGGLRRPRRALGAGRRPGNPAGGPATRVRSLLPGGRGRRLRKRDRARNRPGARQPHGRIHRAALGAGQHVVYAGTAPCARRRVFT